MSFYYVYMEFHVVQYVIRIFTVIHGENVLQIYYYLYQCMYLFPSNLKYMFLYPISTYAYWKITYCIKVLVKDNLRCHLICGNSGWGESNKMILRASWLDSKFSNLQLQRHQRQSHSNNVETVFNIKKMCAMKQIRALVAPFIITLSLVTRTKSRYENIKDWSRRILQLVTYVKSTQNARVTDTYM